MSITITISDPRAVDGWIEAANRAGVTPEVIALDFLNKEGIKYADLFKIAVLTSAAFVQRFTAAEYGAIRAAAEQSAEVNGLIQQLIDSATVVLSDPRILPALELLTAAGLLAPGRAAEIASWQRITRSM
jgi:hypothetical protein